MKNSFVDKKARKRVLDELEIRFRTEYLTVPELAVEIFAPKHELASITAQTKTRGILMSLKNRFAKQGIWFGCVDDDGRFGIMKDKSHGQYVVTQYYKRMKGIAIRASQASTEAHLKDLLPAGTRNERLIIPSAIESGE